MFVCITVIATSSPSNEAELQLYRVMQRASLLAYYDTLLEMGKTEIVTTISCINHINKIQLKKNSFTRTIN